MQAAIDKFGRVLIPKKIRDHLGLKAGSVVQISEKDHEVLLKLVEHKALLQRQDGILVFMGEANGDVLSIIHDEREKRLKDFF